MTRYPADALRAHAFALLTRAGLAEERARVVAEILVEGDLLGHDTHGLALLAPYLGEIERGAMASRGDLVVVNERPAACCGTAAGCPGRGSRSTPSTPRSSVRGSTAPPRW